jgi:hypothetical protein
MSKTRPRALGWTIAAVVLGAIGWSSAGVLGAFLVVLIGVLFVVNRHKYVLKKPFNILVVFAMVLFVGFFFWLAADWS